MKLTTHCETPKRSYSNPSIFFEAYNTMADAEKILFSSYRLTEDNNTLRDTEKILFSLWYTVWSVQHFDRHGMFLKFSECTFWSLQHFDRHVQISFSSEYNLWRLQHFDNTENCCVEMQLSVCTNATKFEMFPTNKKSRINIKSYSRQNFLTRPQTSAIPTSVLVFDATTIP